MKGVARMTDLSTPLAMPRVAIEGSPKTFADALGVNRMGDNWSPHVPHPTPGTIIASSTKSFSEGKAWGLMDDPITCGDTVATASNKTFSI